MSGVLLDTSAYSALGKNHPGIVSFLEEAQSLFFSPITLGELWAGFRKGTFSNKNENALRLFMEKEDVVILPINEETALRYAIIFDALRKAGTPVASHDLWIAASAMQHGLRVLTTDRDFQKIPQIITDYFDPA